MTRTPPSRPPRRRPAAASMPVEREHLRFAAEIPGVVPGRPAWRLSVELTTEAQGDGERLRLRAHLQSHLGEALGALAAQDRHAALPHHRDDERAPATTALAPAAARFAAQGIGLGVRLALKLPAVRRLAEPLLRHRVDSWMEVHASTADLASGAQGLVPNLESLRQIGIEPPAGEGPLAQTWAGPTHAGADAGVAQVSLLRLDRRDLPTNLAALLGTRPFSLAAAIVNLVEPAPTRPSSAPRDAD